MTFWSLKTLIAVVIVLFCYDAGAAACPAKISINKDQIVACNNQSDRSSTLACLEKLFPNAIIKLGSNKKFESAKFIKTKGFDCVVFNGLILATTAILGYNLEFDFPFASANYQQYKIGRFIPSINSICGWNIKGGTNRKLIKPFNFIPDSAKLNLTGMQCIGLTEISGEKIGLHDGTTICGGTLAANTEFYYHPGSLVAFVATNSTNLNVTLEDGSKTTLRTEVGASYQNRKFGAQPCAWEKVPADQIEDGSAGEM